MIKDKLLQVIFIPLLGISLPLIASIVSFERHSIAYVAGAVLYFILTSFLIWQGCKRIHTRLRPLYKPIVNPLSKIVAICGVSSLYTAVTSCLSVFLWFVISPDEMYWPDTVSFMLYCIVSSILFTLLYELLFLSKEKEIDNRVVAQLDKELSQAELQVLANEMDPHFIFNSLNTLNYLIKHEPKQALLFNTRLAQVYKYFLINKNKELIALKEELDFIEDYFYLLQIRHDNKLQLRTQLPEESHTILIPPCSLQILIENAIKHNEFSIQHPLAINISACDKFLQITNPVKPKSYAVNSTGIGLKNLSSRYKLIFKKDITIETTHNNFTVKLPLNNTLLTNP